MKQKKKRKRRNSEKSKRKLKREKRKPRKRERENKKNLEMEKRRTEINTFGKMAQAIRVKYTALFNFRNWCDDEGLEMISGFDNDEITLEPFAIPPSTKTVDEITADISKLEEFIKLLKDVRTGEEISAIESKHQAKRQQTIDSIKKNVQMESESVAHAKETVAESYRVRELELKAKYEEELNKIKGAYQDEGAPNTTMTAVYEEEN